MLTLLGLNELQLQLTWKTGTHKKDKRWTLNLNISTNASLLTGKMYFRVPNLYPIFFPAPSPQIKISHVHTHKYILQSPCYWNLRSLINNTTYFPFSNWEPI